MRIRPVFYLGIILAACESSSTTEDNTEPDCTSAPVALSVGGTVNGTLTGKDCADRGKGPYDRYSLTLSGSPVRVTVTPTGFPAAVLIEDRSRPAGSQTIVAEPDADGTATLYLPAATYNLDLGTSSAATGAYTIAVASGAASGCSGEQHITASGAVISGAITTTDCVAQQYFNDHFQILMTAGRDYGISLDAPSGMSLSVRLRDNATVLATRVADDGKVTDFTFRPSTTGWYDIGLVAFPQGSTKSYTLRIQ